MAGVPTSSLSTAAPIRPSSACAPRAPRRRPRARRGADTAPRGGVRGVGRGPYHFVLDSGADTSVVGLRIARDLQLPLGTPVVLNNMTDRNVVDRVRVDSLSLGPSVIRDLQLP